MVLVAALFQCSYFLHSFKIIEANTATLFRRISFPHPCFFRNSWYLPRFEAFWHLAVIFLKFEQLFVGHIVRIWVVWILGRIVFAFLDRSLEETLFLGFCAMCTGQAVHHDLHHYFSFSIFDLLVLYLHGQLQLSQSVSPSRLLALWVSFTSSSFFSLFVFVLQFLYLTSEFEVLGA